VNPAFAFATFLALVSGVLVALQTPTNALLARGVASPVNAAFVSFAVGTAALAMAALMLGVRPSAGAARALPWYAWTGGLYGAFFVAAAAYAAPRIGITFYITLLIGGQLAIAMLLDHLGAFGLSRQEVTITKVVGVVLVMAGAVLVRR